ncbi:MAG: prepilin peptidase [Thermodesulfovibrionia bacterium]|nr:prepilin peptidase [Thermodesulfovibrionia bacterium]
MSNIFLYGIVFVFGSVVGSFLNVCIYRIPRGMSIIIPSSRCPSCSTPIEPWNNIPIISYILLRGRCRFCKEKISLQYPIVESLNAFLYMIIVWRFGTSIAWFLLVYFVFVSSLIIITFIDIEHQIIPDRITLPGILLALIFGATILPDPFSRFDFLGFSNSFIGVVLGGGLFYLIAVLGKAVFKKDAMGGGDIKMMAMVGGFLGWKGVILTTFLGSLLGSVIGISLLLMKGREWGSKIPFGPYLALGTLISMLSGQELLRWYLYAV